tara:strand:- start:99 stop:224 length:126 start_codon:yes stop_codon:yes gene_type:complete
VEKRLLRDTAGTLSSVIGPLRSDISRDTGVRANKEKKFWQD